MCELCKLCGPCENLSLQQNRVAELAEFVLNLLVSSVWHEVICSLGNAWIWVALPWKRLVSMGSEENLCTMGIYIVVLDHLYVSNSLCICNPVALALALVKLNFQHFPYAKSYFY